MTQIRATIVERESIGPAWWQLTLEAPGLSPPLQAGQFLMLRCGGYSTCYLRRPIFPRFLGENRLSLLIRPQSDPGLAWLSARQAGDTLDVIGPQGTGFSLPHNIDNLLLISNTQLLSPLLGLMDQAVEAGLSVTLALEGSRAATLYPATRLPAPVELQVATLDGSRGQQGSITSLLPNLLRWADRVCAVGSPALYRLLKEQTQLVRFGVQPDFLYALVNTYPIACGLGACFSCAIETERGLKLTCTDGPVFDLAAIDFGGVYYG